MHACGTDGGPTRRSKRGMGPRRRRRRRTARRRQARAATAPGRVRATPGRRPAQGMAPRQAQAMLPRRLRLRRAPGVTQPLAAHTPPRPLRLTTTPWGRPRGLAVCMGLSRRRRRPRIRSRPSDPPMDLPSLLPRKPQPAKPASGRAPPGRDTRGRWAPTLAPHDAPAAAAAASSPPLGCCAGGLIGSKHTRPRVFRSVAPAHTRKPQHVAARQGLGILKTNGIINLQASECAGRTSG